MSLKAGKLRHRVRFERQVAEVDSDGDTVQKPDGTLILEWQLVTERWAAVEPISAREFIQSATTQALVVARVTIRATPLVDYTMIGPTCRMVWRGDNYQIEGVLPDKDSGLEYFTLPVSRGVNQGE